MTTTFLTDLHGPTGPQGPQGIAGVNGVANDAATGGYISTDGTATELALRPRLQTRALAAASAINASRFIAVGDSITSSSSGLSLTSHWGDWMLHSALQSNSIVPIFNAGYDGANSATIQAAFVADVIAKNPSMVAIMPGRNDSAAVPPQASIDLVTFALAECRKIGCELVIVNATPEGTAALSAPATVTATITATTGATNALGLLKYKVSALNAAGETLPSTIASVTTVNATSQVRIDWSDVPGAVTYKVYKETSIGSGTYGLINTTTAITTPGYYSPHYFADQGGVTPTTAPAVSNTTAVTTANQAHAARRNAWFSQFAAKNGLLLIDVYSLLADASGLYKTGLTWDGIHPNGQANAIIGKAVADGVRSLVKQVPATITKTTTDPLNLVGDGLLMSGTTRPTSWTVATSPTWDTAATNESLAARTGFLGRAYLIERTGGGSVTATGPNITSGFSIGDSLIVSAMIECVTAAAGSRASLSLVNQAAASVARMSIVAADYTTPTVMSWRVTVPTGTTGMNWISTMGGIGKFYIGQLTIYNATTNTWLA